MIRRFDALDSLRGIAALLVVVYHMHQMKLVPQLMPHGYLAVDFFFILSGVVIAHSYEKRLSNGMSLGKFTLLRMARIYPLSFMGALIGLLLLITKHLTYPEKVENIFQILISGLLNLALLPTFFGSEVSEYTVFPGNGPLWSLFFELAVNIVWFIFLANRKTSILIAVTAICGAVYSIATIQYGSANLGWNVETFWIGFFRVTFGFVFGVLIYRALVRFPVKQIKGATLLFIVILIALMLPKWGAWWDVFCFLFILPLTVYFSSAQGSGKIGRVLGDLSFPVYILHFPMLGIISGVRQVFRWDTGPASLITIFFAIILASWMILKLYDEPIRQRLAILLKKY